MRRSADSNIVKVSLLAPIAVYLVAIYQSWVAKLLMTGSEVTNDVELYGSDYLLFTATTPDQSIEVTRAFVVEVFLRQAHVITSQGNCRRAHGD